VFAISVKLPSDSVKLVCRCAYDRSVHQRPDRLRRLPEQYFASLLQRVETMRRDGGEPVIDLGRGNPDLGPPAKVVDVLTAAFELPGAHGYAPFRGIPVLREAIAARYQARYGVSLDPDRQVAVVPGTKAAIVELALALASRGERILLPDPHYPDYRSGVALAGAELALLPLEASNGWQPDFAAAPAAAACFLNYPSNPCAVCAAPGVFTAAVEYASRTGTVIVHDAAYIDLVFDGRAPESFLATEGAEEHGVELWSMSKSYGMAGWRIGFVLGNEEIVERVNLLSDHSRVGMLAALQHAAAAALASPESDVEGRRAAYERRRDLVLAALPATVRCEGTFYVWLELPPHLTVDDILRGQRVALAPGEGFGSRGAGYARLSLAVPDETLRQGLARLAPVLSGSVA
jgi:aminotransferase